MYDHVYTSKKFKKIRRSEGVPTDNVFLWSAEWSWFDLNLFQNSINIRLWVFQTQNWSLSALDLNPQLTKIWISIMFDPLKNLVTDCNYTHIFEIRYGFQYLFSLEDLLKDPIISDQSTFLISYIFANSIN